MGQLLQLLGAGLVLGAFLFRRRLDRYPRLYLWLNAAGSGILAALAVQARLVGFALLELVWCAGALASLAPRSLSPASPARARPSGDAHVR